MRLLFLIGVLAQISTNSAFAYNYGKDQEAARLLSVGAGMSSPSFTSAQFENPAGLIANYRFRLMGYAASSDGDFNPLTAGAGLFFGNQNVGGAIGGQTTPVIKSGNNVPRANEIFAGLSAHFEPLKLALGTALFHSTSNGDSSIDGNLGLMFNPQGNVRVGLMAMGFREGFNGYGGGIAFDAKDATLAIDGAMDKDGDGKIIKPGFGIYMGEIQLSAGYGIEVDDNGSHLIEKDVSVGAGVNLGQTVHLQFYYNQLAKYFFGLSVRM